MSISDHEQSDGQRRAGRPRTRILTQKRITDAAMRVATHEGYDSLTMANLAKALDVTPAALYNHAHSKRQILRWIEDRLMAAVDASAFETEPWDAALAAWARSYRLVMKEHDSLVEAIAKMPVAGATDTLAMYESVASGLRQAGWPDASIMPAIVAIESFIYGSAYDLNAPLDIFDLGEHADAAPTLAASVAAHSPEVLREQAFERGLEALIRGLGAASGA
ncbi:TetR/AcrR family transcriptional regulator [Pseudoclavibacter helvolus]|uniref:TetR/AcrR family transcriptional regulator n=1 Tax=Pseudoclavibacter helvolus TaxID=255205 RepID=UPI000A6C94E5|nr:TetR/AcrR family transcriptional regulator [Pseudoclavibacter helvolus]